VFFRQEPPPFFRFNITLLSTRSRLLPTPLDRERAGYVAPWLGFASGFWLPACKFKILLVSIGLGVAAEDDELSPAGGGSLGVVMLNCLLAGSAVSSHCEI
jgi:hypothetical protein